MKSPCIFRKLYIHKCNDKNTHFALFNSKCSIAEKFQSLYDFSVNNDQSIHILHLFSLTHSFNTSMKFTPKILHSLKFIRKDAIIRNVVFSEMCFKISSFFIVPCDVCHYKRGEEIYLEFMMYSWNKSLP